MNRLRTALLVLTVVLLIVSAAALLVHPSIDSDGYVPAASIPPAPDISDTSRAESLAAIVANNLFDENRGAVQRR